MARKEKEKKSLSLICSENLKSQTIKNPGTARPVWFSGLKTILCTGSIPGQGA